jgi:poly(3-hydroxybutyrate) depolymerase
MSFARPLRRANIPRVLRGLVSALVFAALGASLTACADERQTRDGPAPDGDDVALCGASFTVLPGACAYVPSSLTTPLTLVYYAHGMFAEGARPERELDVVRAAADLYGFAVLAPRGRKGLCTWSDDVKSFTCWPSRRDAVDARSAELLGTWIAAEHRMATTLGTRFERHYALGFSNGGYFIAYVAADGLLALDGAAIVGAGRTDVDDAHLARRAIPIFVGVGAEELPFTLDAAARLSSDLAGRGWPVDATMHEGRGHELADDDFDLAWLAWSR